MSELQSALGGASFKGYVAVSEAGLKGMITLRGDLASKPVKEAVKSLTGTKVPEARAIVSKGAYDVAWMSPDELLIMLPHAEADAACGQLTLALKGAHHLVANVSDARALFTLKGAACREILAKLAPVDTSPPALPPGQLRRSRLAQVPAAMWLTDEQNAHVICFRSVATYVFDILADAAAPGGEIM